MVALLTRESASFNTGIDSPVSIDSSTLEEPDITKPSTGIDSPDLTINMSSIFTSSTGTTIS